jgi:NADPH:quinone reductase
MTAALSLFKLQSLPPHWSPASEAIPLIIYGASSALGSFAIKLAKASNIHPIIAIGGASYEYASSLLDPGRGDRFIDYRQGPAEMKNAVKAALGNLEALHALDAISSNGTWIPARCCL